MTQTDLGGKRYTAAYISTLESGRRKPSHDALNYLAERLGVDQHELALGAAATWPLDIAMELRRTGRGEDARRLLERLLTVLDEHGKVDPVVLVVTYRELGLIERNEDPAAAEGHLKRAVEVCGKRGDVPAAEAAKTWHILGDFLRERNDLRGAMDAYRAASDLLLNQLPHRDSSNRRASNAPRKRPSTRD